MFTKNIKLQKLKSLFKITTLLIFFSFSLLFFSCSVLKHTDTKKQIDSKNYSSLDTTKLSSNINSLDTSKTNLLNTNSFQSLDINKVTTSIIKDSIIVKKDSTIIDIRTTTATTTENTHASKKDTSATKITTEGKTVNIITDIKKGVQTDSGSKKIDITTVTDKKTAVLKYSWLIYLLIPIVAGILIYFKFIKK